MNNESSSPSAVIFGTDFSTGSHKAGSVAAALAGKLQGRLQIIHAFDSSALAGADPATLNALRESISHRLAEETERFRSAGHAADGDIMDGDAEQVLAEQTEKARAAYLVVSSLGGQRADRLFIGSVAGRVALSATRPVLVVRDDQPFLDWSAGRKKLRVLCGFDFSAASEAAMREAARLRALGPCEFIVAFVDGPFAEEHICDSESAPATGAAAGSAQAGLDSDLAGRVREILGGGGWRSMVLHSWGQPGFRLAEVAAAEKVDLVVTACQPRHGLERLRRGSTARSVLKYSPTNVLMVPVPATPALEIHSVRRVLVPVDLSDIGFRAIPQACSLLPSDGSLTIVHVASRIGPQPETIEDTPLPAATRLSPDDPIRRQVEESLAPYRSWLGTRPGLQIEVRHLTSDDPAGAITRLADQMAADVICMGSHGRSGWKSALLGSTTQKVIARSRRPVLVVPVR